MYGSGLRVSECLQLRVQDIDFEHLSLTVHNGKGGKDRQTLLSSQLIEPLKLAIKRGIAVQAKDKEMGVGSSLPYQLGKKYKNAAFSASWAFIFPSANHCYHPVTGVLCRHHLHTSVIQKAIKVAANRANIHNKRVTCHAFRHSFASELIRSGSDILTVQELLGHSDIRTTQIYTHVIGKHYAGTNSPLDALAL